jgi:type II secretory pathway component PulF
VLSILVRSGVPILDALDLVADIGGNVVVANSVRRLRFAVQSGETMTHAMGSDKLFPPMLVQMVSVGEEIGRLDMMLEKSAKYYDAEADYMIQNLSAYLEPMILLLVGGLVTFLALSIFLPMWSVLELARGGMG